MIARSQTEPGKRDLRRIARASRADISAGERTVAARAAADHLMTHLRSAPIGIAAAYYPINNELDPLPAMTALGAAGWRTALPVVVEGTAVLLYRAWRPGDATRPGAFGIQEPLPEADQLTPDVVLAPLLAFDRRGGRLGFGAGYYDATLQALRSRGPVIAIGLAFETQEVDHVPTEPHDQRLDAVATPVGIMLI